MTDTLTVSVRPFPQEKWTRRSVLSVANSVYDPMGWLVPVTLTAKLVMQDIVKTTQDWDKPLTKLQHAA